MESYIIKDADGVAVNSVVWDGVSDWSPPEGHTVELLSAQPEGFVFDPPEVVVDLAPPIVLSADEIAARVAALQEAIVALQAAEAAGQVP